MTPAARHRASRWVGAVAAVCLGTSFAAVGPRVHAEGSAPLSTGLNSDGQLATGTTTSRPTPGPMGLANIVDIASGRDHGYAIDDQGRLWAWGDNSRGQIGDGTTIDRPTPVMVLTEVSAVAAGDHHGIAVRQDETVWTWGLGAAGQLGLGTTNNRTTPTQVPGLDEGWQVAAGRDMSFVLAYTAQVFAFGDNTYGQLGDGTNTHRLSPVSITSLFGTDAIAAGRDHGLAQSGDGALWAWGANKYGQLGDGTKTNRSTPRRILPASAGVRSFDGGADHSIATLVDGTVRTWGRGYRGQLGSGSTSNRLTPQPVPNLSRIESTAVGRDQSFAIGADGTVWAWGFNDNGQLGDGTVTERHAPVRLTGLPPIAQVAGGRAMTYFLPRSSPPPQPEVLASSAFDDGLAGFTNVDGMVVDSSRGSTSGPPSARVAVTGRAGVARLPLSRDVNQACASVDVRITSIGSAAPHALLNLLNTDGVSTARLQATSTGGLTMRTHASGTTYGTGIRLAAGIWNHLVLCVFVPTGEISVQVNNNEVRWYTGNVGTLPLASVQLGEPWARTATVNWDDLVVDAAV